MKIKNSQKGQSLIEVLIALAAAVAVVAAIAVTVVTSLSNVDFTKNQNLATQYSGEGLEIIRQLAKNNWTNFKSTYQSPDYCLNKAGVLTVMQGLECTQNVGIFKRQIILKQDDMVKCSGSIRVESKVFWSDSRCLEGEVFCHNISLETCLADINPIGGIDGGAQGDDD